MQSPDPGQNYFELFGLKPGFDLNTDQLHSEQQRLQSIYHPDRYISASDRDKRTSVQLASWVNQAYETLRDPVKRSRYLLEIGGAELPDDSQTTSDTTFLMEQLELREEIDACRNAENAMQQSEAIESRLSQRANELAAQFVTAYEARDLDLAQVNSQKMQFIQRIHQQLTELQYELEDA
jgi:molecular chaperone HscB